MKTLLASLTELRVILLTVLLSGGLHLSIIGAGWFSDEPVARTVGQNLQIRVTASRPAGAVSKAQPEPAPPVPEPAVSQERPLSEVVPAAEPVAQLPVPSKPPKPRQPTPVVKPVTVKEPVVQEQLPDQTDQMAEAVSESALVPSAPVYRQQPEFLHPPKQPRYPRRARERGIEGEVLIRVDIDKLGAVTGMSIVSSSGSGLLDSSALNAIKEWRFAAARESGIAVASYVNIPIKFELE